MTAPRSIDLRNAVITRLETISQANGFNTDIGASVLRGRRKYPLDKIPLPSLFVVSQTDAPPDKQSNPEQKRTRAYAIEAFLDADVGDYESLQDEVLHDMISALTQTDAFVLDGLAIRATFGTAVLDVPELDGTGIVTVNLPLTLSYPENYRRT
ncbi:hypothetical protein [Guyparkeria sp.]|uniref:hypothetical protein n=1 Tax=Guyparkeria sp. TaxID=2035736 RepID=UPI003970FDCF